MNLKKGASVIEILVALAIFAVITALGLGTIQSFKSGTELNADLRLVENKVEEVRNRARNRVVSDTSPIEYNSDQIFENKIKAYVISFPNNAEEENSMEIRSCTYNQISGQYECGHVEETVVTISSISATCSGVMYETLSADMNLIFNISSYDYIDPVSFNTSRNCALSVKHPKRDAIDYFFTYENNSFGKKV